jgi:uncharacterized protein (DUF362 family)
MSGDHAPRGEDPARYRLFGRPMTRRRFLIRAAELGLATGAVGLGVGAILERIPRSPWDPRVFPSPAGARVAVLSATSYTGDLERTVMEGVKLIGLEVNGASVLLKPNMVEYDPGSVVNTDPRLVVATVAVMKRLGARSVTVAEGPGHRRDTQYVVERSGLRELLRDVDAPFVDLNTAALTRVSLKTGWTDLHELWLPSQVMEADVVISMPKMKTHHWGGVTLSLKNMFGTVPGRIYGWPKNVLHWAGLQESILDVAAAVRPHAAIVDGIVGMQGDGPIKGDPIAAGHLVFGTDPVAVDATAASLMGVDPERVGYIHEAGRFLGQADLARITQVGEDPQRLVTPFALRPEFAGLRAGSSGNPVGSQPANAAGG